MKAIHLFRLQNTEYLTFMNNVLAFLRGANIEALNLLKEVLVECAKKVAAVQVTYGNLTKHNFHKEITNTRNRVEAKREGDNISSSFYFMSKYLAFLYFLLNSQK